MIRVFQNDRADSLGRGLFIVRSVQGQLHGSPSQTHGKWSSEGSRWFGMTFEFPSFQLSDPRILIGQDYTACGR